MGILRDEGGQGAAEYILLFGGVIVMAVAAIIIYKSYFTGTGNSFSSSSDVASIRSSVNK